MPRSPSSSKREWRRSAKTDANGSRRWVKRLVMTACLLGMTGALVWLLWPTFRPTTHFVMLPMTEYRLWLQPAPALPGNLAGFQEAAQAGQFHLLKEPHTGVSIKENLGSQLNGIISDQRGRDVLILYITAHGVSRGGKAYLLAADFDVAQPESGQVELGQLFGQLRKCPAKIKLLLLEAGHNITDPRLGMLANEFHHLLVSELEAFDDPNLWVLTANQSLEASHISYPLGKSVFSHFVSQGLTGAADKEGNTGDVELAELFTFVRDGVTHRVKQQSRGSQTQTPLLIHAGEGPVDQPPDGLFLVHITPPDEPPPDESEAEDDEESEPAEDKTPDEAEGSGNGGNGDSEEPEAAQPNDVTTPKENTDPKAKADAAPSEKPEKPKTDTPAPGTEPEPDPSAAPPSPSKKETAPQPPAKKEPAPKKPDEPADGLPELDGSLADVRQLLDAAWRWRDEFQSRQNPDGWSPVDYAPHLWHEYQELLLVHELRWRYQMPLPDEQLATLKRLAAGHLPAPGVRQGTVLDRLAEARQKFLQSPEKAAFDRWSPQLPVLQRALKLRNDLFFEVPYYLRWHARVSQVTPDDPTLYKKILQLVDQLARLDGLIESLQPRDETAESPPPNPRTKLSQLEAQTETLQRLRTELIDRELNGLAQSLVDETPDERSPTKIESLLWTPLLAAKLRMRLLDALLNQPAPSEDALAILPYTTGRDEWFDDRRPNWFALSNQAELEVAVIQKLADPNFSTTTDPSKLSDGGTAQAEEKLWLLYRQLGLELSNFYRDLPTQVERALRSDDPQETDRSGRVLALVDPREVHARIHDGTQRLALPPIDWLVVVGPRPTVEGPDVLALAPKDWAELSLQIRITGRRVAKVSLVPDFDPTQVTIQSFDGGTTYRPRSAAQVDLGPDGQKTLRLRVRPADDVETFKPLSIKVSAEGDETALNVRFLIPPPDRVDLVVERLLNAMGRRVECPTGDDGTVHCPVFPNRPAEYRLGLRNMSQKPRTVTVRFWSVPPRDPQDNAARIGPLNDIDRPLPGFSPLTDPVEIKLPPDDSFVPLAFPPPEDAKEKEADTPAPAPAAEPTPEGDAPANLTPITHGLVCQIVDPDAKTPWVRWVDFDWVTPFEYIKPSVSYDLSRKRVSIVLQLQKDDDVTPGMLSETPVSILWENALDLPENTSPNFQAAIATADGVARLWAENIDPEVTKRIEIRLAVDGYPRALIFEPFDCNLDHRRIDVNDNPTAVRITQPEEKAPYKLTDSGLDPAMSVTFQVDAPYDALQQAEDFVKVGIDKDGNLRFDAHEKTDVLTFHTDRQMAVDLQEFTPEGTLKLITRLDDYTVELSPTGPANAQVLILSQLFIAGSKSAQHQVPVILDRGQPAITLKPFPKSIPPGTPLAVPVEATDVSGVVLVEFGFDVNRSGALEDDENPVKLFTADADGIWQGLLETADLTPGATYSLIVRATDRVGSVAQRKALVTIGTVAKAAMPERPKTVTVQGRAYLGSADGSARWSTLKIGGIPGTAKVDKATGDFTFTDVPPSDYTLTAQGTSGNRSKKGSAKITVTGDEPTVRVNIPME